MIGRRFFPFWCTGHIFKGDLFVSGSVCVRSIPSLFSQPLLCDCFLQVTETGGSSVSVAWLRRGSEKVGEVQILLHFDYPFGMVKKNCGDILYFPMPGRGFCQWIDPGYLHTFFYLH